MHFVVLGEALKFGKRWYFDRADQVPAHVHRVEAAPKTKQGENHHSVGTDGEYNDTRMALNRKNTHPEVDLEELVHDEERAPLLAEFGRRAVVCRHRIALLQVLLSASLQTTSMRVFVFFFVRFPCQTTCKERMMYQIVVDFFSALGRHILIGTGVRTSRGQHKRREIARAYSDGGHARVEDKHVQE